MNIYKLLNKIFNTTPYFTMNAIIKLLARIRTSYIVKKQKRRQKFNKVYSNIRTNLFGYCVLKNAKSIGENFYCGGWSSVNKNTILKDHVNFNGLRIEGDGKVTIGRYFHSGTECLIITRNHNYDTGEEIPYDKSFVYKDIEIGGFCMAGFKSYDSSGYKNRRGCYYSGRFCCSRRNPSLCHCRWKSRKSI